MSTKLSRTDGHTKHKITFWHTTEERRRALVGVVVLADSRQWSGLKSSLLVYTTHSTSSRRVHWGRRSRRAHEYTRCTAPDSAVWRGVHFTTLIKIRQCAQEGRKEGRNGRGRGGGKSRWERGRKKERRERYDERRERMDRGIKTGMSLRSWNSAANIPGPLAATNDIISTNDIDAMKKKKKGCWSRYLSLSVMQ